MFDPMGAHLHATRFTVSVDPVQKGLRGVWGWPVAMTYLSQRERKRGLLLFIGRYGPAEPGGTSYRPRCSP